MEFRSFLIDFTYFAAAVLFLVGLKRMSSPRTARGSLLWAGWGMLLAVLVTFFWPGLPRANLVLIGLAILLGGTLAWYIGRKALPADLPGTIALCNGLGGGAAAAIAAAQLTEGGVHSLTVTFLAALGGLLGAVSFSGSLVAFARLRGRLEKPVRFRSQGQVNAAVLLIAAVFGLMLMGNYPSHTTMTVIFFLLALLGGAMIAVPLVRGDVPVFVSLFNGLTGLAVACEGFALGNEAMIIAGTVVAAAAARLTQLVARGIDRPLGSVLSSAFGGSASTSAETGGATR